MKHSPFGSVAACSNDRVLSCSALPFNALSVCRLQGVPITEAIGEGLLNYFPVFGGMAIALALAPGFGRRFRLIFLFLVPLPQPFELCGFICFASRKAGPGFGKSHGER